MSDRGATIKDPVLNAAFAEGVKQGMQEIYSGDEPTWEVTVSFDGTSLRQFTTTRPSEVINATTEALMNGCSVKIDVVPPSAVRTAVAALTVPDDDEVVDAEIVD